MLFEHGFGIEILKMSPELFAWRYMESGGAQTDHFAAAFFAKKLRAAMTFESLQLAPFCLEKFSVRKRII